MRRADRSAAAWSAAELGAFTDGRPRAAGAMAGRVSHLRIDPEIELDGPHDPDGSTRRALLARRLAPGATDPAGLDPAHRPRPRTRTALWGDLRKKWRQYVNKARTGGVLVVDADGDRLPEFYRIYRETADRAGFLIRTESAYRDVWEAYRPAGRARLLFAQTADGEPLATLFLVRCGTRVVEPYGGMTAGRRRHPRELPPQVGGHPLLARGGRDDLRPVGPRDRRDRPLQDRFRGSRGALHRGVGSRARPARAVGLRHGGVGP